MEGSRTKTLRHIETVRNFIGGIICELIHRQQQHDQSKLEDPEVEMFEKFTPLLRKSTFGSEEYKGHLMSMQAAVDHHYRTNKHHPEYYLMGPENASPVKNSVFERMDLIDLMEMACDWYAASLRHDDGDYHQSLEINQKRYGFSDETKSILLNTIQFLEHKKIYHKAEES